MKKALKILSIVFLCIFIIFLVLVALLNLSVKDIKLDESKLINVDNSIIYYDIFNNVIKESTNGNDTVKIEDIPKHVINAFISIEDKRFYSHNGVDYRSLVRAVFKNVKSGFLKEGASTITQQLIKNTHLTNQKTFKRKIAEIKLAKQLEKKYTKSQILEKYLNTIYFGENCYGISKASKYYFNKSVKELTINESASLAGCIKAPTHYSPTADAEKNFNRKNVVLNQMYKQKYITEEQLNQNLTMQVTVSINNKSGYDALDLIKPQINDFISKNVYNQGNIRVYTTINTTIQENLMENILENKDDCNKTAIILDKYNHIIAFYSTVKDDNRQLGSTLKPIVVYAPAIQTGTVDSCSFIDDEKTDFNGYSPSNYNDIYYGKVTIKQSLAKSLNTCSAKIMNLTGVDNCIEYAKKTGVKFTNNDYNLATSLGATENGANLLEITSSYGVFPNMGYYIKPTGLLKIQQEDNTEEFSQEKTQVFTNDTCFILNDMLRYTVTSGTAKQLSFNNYPICGKTGTVGTKNGNSDAYCISYTNDYIVGVRFSSNDNLMSNNITGGNSPTILSNNIWSNLYENKSPTDFDKSTDVQKVLIDKISYDKDKVIEIADDNAPNRYVIEEYFTKNSKIKNKSTRFTNPKMQKPKTIVFSKGIILQLCLVEYCDYLIFRENNGIKQMVYDSNAHGKNEEFIDTNLLPDTEYVYSLVPYFIGKNQVFYGEEIVVNKIKTPTSEIAGDDWWFDEFI